MGQPPRPSPYHAAASLDPYGEVFDSLEALRAWTDARLKDRTAGRRCPATGTSIPAAARR